MKTAKKSRKVSVVPVGRRGAKSRLKEKPVTKPEIIPVSKTGIHVAPVVAAPKAAKIQPVRDEQGRCTPGLTLSRVSGEVLAPGSIVPFGGADYTKMDRSVEILEKGATVPKQD